MSIYQKKFKNGITLMYEEKDTEAAHCRFVFGVGSFYEDNKTRGISHLIEHLMFNSCPGLSSIEFNERMNSLGAIVNASTSTEFTRYYFGCLHSSLIDCFDLYLRILFSFKVTQPILEKELTVVCNEIGASKDDNWDVFEDRFNNTIFRKHPIAYPILGYEDVLRSLSVEDVQNYYEDHYGTDNLYVIIVGKLEADEKDYIEAKLDSLQAKEAVKRISIDEKDTQPLVPNVVSFKDMEQTIIQARVFLSNKVFEDNWKSKILTYILGGTMSSFLWNEFREKRSLAYIVGASAVVIDKDHQYLSMYAAMNNSDDVELAKELFKNAIDYAKTISEETFNKGFIFCKTQEILGLQKVIDIAWAIEDQIYEESSIDYKQNLKNLDKVSYKSFKDFVDKIDPDGLLVGVLYPTKVQTGESSNGE